MASVRSDVSDSYSDARSEYVLFLFLNNCLASRIPQFGRFCLLILGSVDIEQDGAAEVVQSRRWLQNLHDGALGMCSTISCLK